MQQVLCEQCSQQARSVNSFNAVRKYMCVGVLTAAQRQYLRHSRCPIRTACSMTRDAVKSAGAVRRPANRKEDSSRGRLVGVSCKKARVDSSPPPPAGHSVLRPLSATSRGRRELRLVVTACWPALSSAPRPERRALACAFKRGLCEYLFKSAFPAPRARQSPRPTRQTLRPASRYTDGRYRRPPPVCNCVSGSREPNRALTEQ